MMEALQLLKFRTRQGRGLNFTSGFDRDEEIAELEGKEEGRPVEDLHTFLHTLND